jgi:hypothetical protein
MGKTRFEGVLVRNLADRKSWSKKDLPLRDDDVRITLITLQEAREQAEQLRGLPLLMAHNPAMQIGRVVDARVTPQRELRAVLELDHEDTLACHGIREKILHALSLSHCAGRNKPLEVSLCKTPRRPGCMIDFELDTRGNALQRNHTNTSDINSIATRDSHSAPTAQSHSLMPIATQQPPQQIVQAHSVEIKPHSINVPSAARRTASVLHNMSVASASSPAVAPASVATKSSAPAQQRDVDMMAEQAAAQQSSTQALENSQPITQEPEMTRDQILAEILTNENMPETYRDTVMDLAKERAEKQKQLEQQNKHSQEQQAKIEKLEQEAASMRKSHQTDRDWMKTFMSNVMKSQDLSVSQSEIDHTIDQGHLDQPIVRQLVQCMGQKLRDQQLLVNPQQAADLANLKMLRSRDPFQVMQRPIARPAAAQRAPLAMRSLEELCMTGPSLAELRKQSEQDAKRSRNHY